MKKSLPPTTSCPVCAGTGKVLDRRAFGAQMQAKREAAGLTLKALAERMGRSIGYVSDLEHGRKAWGNAITRKYEGGLLGEASRFTDS